MVNDNPIEELLAYPGVNVRFYFELRGGCTINWLNFDHNDTWCLQEKGRKDAQAALAIG
jgi:hypothetical protein